MSKRHWIPVIIDLQNDGCNLEQKELLLDIFERIMQTMAINLIRKAFFNLSDFHGIKNIGLDGFELEISKSDCKYGFEGKFTNGEKSLMVIGQLEK